MYSVLGCLTTDEEQCVFPFIYEGKTYNQCIHAGNRWPTTAWCSTKVDNNSEYIHGQYGRCKDPNCKQLPGKCFNLIKIVLCVFYTMTHLMRDMILFVLLQVACVVNRWQHLG